MTAELFQWTDEFSIGIDEMDEQHKELVDLLNQLHTAIREHHGSVTSRQILDKLADYTRTHFAVEESLMRVSKYPNLIAHKEMHADLISQVRALQQKLDTGESAITFELLHFLKVWLMRHINETDKHFGAYFNAIGGGAKWSEEVEDAKKKRKKWWQFW